MSPPTRENDGAGDGGADEGVPWYRNAWFWSGVVVVTIVAAVAVSLLVGTDARDPELSTEDHTEFCRRVDAFWRVTQSGELDPSAGDDSVRRFAAAMAAVADVAPESVRSPARSYADGLADASRKFDLVLEKYGKDSAEANEQILAVVKAVESERSTAIDAVQNYAKKACNIDLLAPLPTTDSTTTGSTPPGSGSPGSVSPGSAPPGSVVPAT